MCLFVCLLISESLRARLCNFQSLFPITIESFNWTEFHCEMENRMNWKFNWKHVSIVDTCVSANIEFISLFSLLGLYREGKHQINKSKYSFCLFYHWKKHLYCTEQNLICPVLMNMKPTWSCSSILRCSEKLLLFSRNVQHYSCWTNSWSSINWPITIDLEGMRLIYACRESGLLLW